MERCTHAPPPSDGMAGGRGITCEGGRLKGAKQACRREAGAAYLYPGDDVVRVRAQRVLQADDGSHHHVVRSVAFPAPTTPRSAHPSGSSPHMTHPNPHLGDQP